jgi:hypothetical protein
MAALLSFTTEVSADVNAITGDGAEVILKQSAVQDLSDSLRGRLLLRGDDGYDKARRILEPSFDKYPGLIVQCAGSADVRNAVNFARAENLLVAVKCGGHSASGKSTCDGGMMIDLSPLRNIRVDPIARTADVSGGSLLGHMDHDTMEYGLVTTAGTVSHTGIGGLTLGAGFGRVGRRFGLALDNVLEVDIITADGEFRRANKDENPDLYWAVRGGGGNFGVVTSFKFQLHPMQRQVIRGHFVFSESDAKNALNFFAEYADNAPDELNVDGGLLVNPSQDNRIINNGTVANNVSVSIKLCYSGPHDQADALLAPIRKAGKLIVDDVRALDYVLVQKMGDNLDPRNARYLKAGFVGVITPQLVDDMLGGLEPHPGRSHSVSFQHAGGAIGRVAEDATAFAHRASKHDLLCGVSWPTGTEGAEHIAYIRRYWTGIESHTRGFYINSLNDKTQVMVNSNYRGNYDRLVKIKNKYDPGNLFRLNANVQPTV